MKEWLPILIACLSFAVAGLSLGWNIYRDVILKAKLRVSFQQVSVVERGVKGSFPDKLVIYAINMGPGSLLVDMIICKTSSFWRRVFRKEKPGIILHDGQGIGSSLPCKLEVGQGANFLFDIEADFTKHHFTHIGIRDSYGRAHWAPAKHVKIVRRLQEKSVAKEEYEAK